MAVKTVLIDPNPILAKKAQKVSEITDEIKNVAQDLLDTVKVAKNPEGAGLSAPQIGVSKRIAVVRNFFDDPIHPEEVHSDDTVLINPKIASHSIETDLDWEGCLSVPDCYGMVERFKKIKVTAKDLDGNILKIKADGFFARTIQHEIDHLDGVLFTSKVFGETITQKELDEKIEQEKLL